MTGALRFTAVYLAAAVAFTAARGDRRIFAYLAVTATAGALIVAVHRWCHTPLTPALAYALSGCGLLHLIGGLLPGDPVFYETWLVPHVLKYDQLVHFTITATLTVVAHRLTNHRTIPAVALALASGFGNEAFEYLSALRFADAYVGGYRNAGWDLVFNAFGAASAAIVLLATKPSIDQEAAGTRSPAACASHVANMSA